MSHQLFPRIRRLSGELLALVLFVPLAVVLGLILTRFPDRFAPSVSPSQSIASPRGLHSASQSPSPSPTHAFQGPTVSPEATQTVTVEIRGQKGPRTYTARVSGDTTVADLLLRLSREQGLQLETKDYGGSLGLFVEGIDGTRSDPQTQTYWHLSVNGNLSPLGASSVRVRAGETVTWSYEKMQEEK